MGRWMMWGAVVVAGLMIVRNLAGGEPVSALPLMLLVFGVEGALLGLVGFLVWTIGGAVWRYVTGTQRL